MFHQAPILLGQFENLMCAMRVSWLAAIVLKDVNSADNETALYVYDMTGKAGTQMPGEMSPVPASSWPKIPAPNGKRRPLSPTLVVPILTVCRYCLCEATVMAICSAST